MRITSDTERGSDEDDAESSARRELALFVAACPDAALAERLLPLRGVLQIGRDVAQGCRIDDRRLSKLHTQVVATLGELSIGDLGSTNGTFVNGQRISQHKLELHDVVRVGDTLLVIVEEPDPSVLERQAVLRAAASTLPILIQGETGTGKEVLAQAIHQASGRAGACVPVNCATLPAELAAAELFGHERGAFSGANQARPGLFRAAHGGTLFLDEIGDLPLALQPTLLRALQEGRVRPVGSEREVAVDTRVVTATHVDLERAVAAHAFRADLLGRLAHIVTTLRPLRARRREILTLARSFAGSKGLTPNVAELLLVYSYPRNVRELKAIVEAAVFASGDAPMLRRRDLKHRIPLTPASPSEPPEEGDDMGEPLPAERREQVRRLLIEHRGNVSQVARELGKPRAQIYRWARALGLDVGNFRS